MTIQNRILAATTTALLILAGSSTLATADSAPEGPFGPKEPFAKDAADLSWGNKEIPTGSQVRREMKEDKRPQCTVGLHGNEAHAHCVNNTDTHYFAAVSTACTSTDENGMPTAKPVNASFAIPAHHSGAAIARCAPGSTAQGISLTGPVTRHEAELMQQNQTEFTIKAFL